MIINLFSNRISCGMRSHDAYNSYSSFLQAADGVGFATAYPEDTSEGFVLKVLFIIK